MMQEFRDKLPGFEQVCHGLLQVLLVYISRKQNLSVISDSSFQLSKECALAKRYIDSNYSQNITLDSLAEITHINKFYLAHSFTECVGQSPINYLTDRRLEACKELLVSSNLSVAQVATSVGFLRSLISHISSIKDRHDTAPVPEPVCPEIKFFSYSRIFFRRSTASTVFS